MNLIDRIRHIPHGVQSISEWLGDGGSVVDAETSQRRADTCLKCDRNIIGWSVSDAVAAAVKRHLEVKNALKLRAVGEKKLGVCAVCTCNLRLLIHEPLAMVHDQMTDEEKSNSPAHCWKLTETL